MTIREIIDRIIEFHQPFESHGPGRDLVLAGDENAECTGIVTTCCATFEVLEKAVELGANFIVTHESIFFGGRVEKEALEKNETYREKMQYITDHKLCIWRDHDHMHGNGRPFYPQRVQNDYIFYGIMKELGWEKYAVDSGEGLKKVLWYNIPKTTGRELAAFLMEKCNLSGLRVVGNLDAEVETVYFTQHVNGGKEDGKILEEALMADAFIPFEICDYTLTQYVRDSGYLGKNKILLEMGHFNGEELGMKYMAKWLAELVDVRVDFVQSGDTFQYIKR